MKLNISGHDVWIPPMDVVRGSMLLDYLRTVRDQWKTTSDLCLGSGVSHANLSRAVRACRFIVADGDQLALVSGTDGWYMLTDDPATIRQFVNGMTRHVRTRSVTTLGEVWVGRRTTTGSVRKEFALLETEVGNIIRTADLILAP